MKGNLKTFWMFMPSRYIRHNQQGIRMAQPKTSVPVRILFDETGKMFPLPVANVYSKTRKLEGKLGDNKTAFLMGGFKCFNHRQTVLQDLPKQTRPKNLLSPPRGPAVLPIFFLGFLLQQEKKGGGTKFLFVFYPSI